MQQLFEGKSWAWLPFFWRAVLAIVILGLLTRLVELQVVRGGYYQTLAEENRVRKIAISAPRGKIYARGGEILANTKEVGKRIVVGSDGVVKNYEVDVTDPADLVMEWMRTYPYAEATAHVVGYIGEVDEDEIGKVRPECVDRDEYKGGAWIGKTGLEAYYDCRLRGVDGEELVEVDAVGRKIRTLGRREPIPGEDIYTNIDVRLVQRLPEIIGESVGVIIVMDVKGEILAMYSSPSFDPNLFVDGQDGELQDQQSLEEVLSDEAQPLFNRSIGGIYHPGSVFKIVTSIAALEEGVIESDFEYEDLGVVRVGEYSYSNWYFTQYGRTEGKIGLVKAIARSTDTFFYELGELVGVRRLFEWAEKLGLDRPSGIDLPGEVGGLVPNPEWKVRVKGEKWFLGNTYHMSIGQGDLAITPLAANIVGNVIASGGKLCRPAVVGGSECSDLGISDESIELVTEGMIGVCSTGGTAYPFIDFKPQVACKTGTAETDDEDATHAWLTAFGPVENPEYVVTVLVEKGGEGSSVAAPMAREVFEYWYPQGGDGEINQ